MLESSIILEPRSTTRSLRRVVPFLKQENIKTVLDYGSGTLRNTNFLLRNGFEVIIIDKKEQLNKISHMPEVKYITKIYSETDLETVNIHVDAVISNFVLNILSKEEQKKILFHISKIIKVNGYLLIEIKKLNNKTFTLEQQNNLDNLIIPLGFNRLISFRNYHSISSLYQKINHNRN